MSPFHIQKSDSQFDLSHGFLPACDPIHRLSADIEAFKTWETFVHELPKLFLSDHFRKLTCALPEFPVTHLTTDDEFERSMLMLSYVAHAYVWHGKPAQTLPAIIAKPWAAVAKHIGRPPVLSYASYALYNWYRLDPQKPIALGNIALLQNFLGGADEEWFILVHVDIEAKAAVAMKAIGPAIHAAENNDEKTLTEQLTIIATALRGMCETMDRMPEYCDPYIYFTRVRPYIHGWKDNPALPNGLLYEGVSEKPFFFKGETGAQSTIIPSLDAVLGVQHADNPLKKHLDEMQSYMPPEHRAFLFWIEKTSTVRACVLAHKNNALLKEMYNACLELISRFRNTHVHYAAKYIQKQTQTTNANSTAVGTGGTPFMAYLRAHLEETDAHLIQ